MFIFFWNFGFLDLIFVVFVLLFCILFACGVLLLVHISSF